MKILIAYAGKTGTSEKCAGILEKKLPNATTIDLNKESANASEYDLIIVGGSIRMGMLNSKVKKFIRKNKNILKTKKCAYYICCGFADNYKSYFEKNISKTLLDEAIIYDTFGGQMNISEQKGLDKFITKLVQKTKEGKKAPEILYENIDNFVQKINEII